MKQQVKVWLQKDSFGTFFIWGTCFLVNGQIPNKPYTKKELEFKELENLQNKPLNILMRQIKREALRLSLEPIIKIERVV